jgi:hypothetical protein
MIEEKLYWVRCTDEIGNISWCLMWGDNSPRWEGYKDAAEERAAMLNASNKCGWKFDVVEVLR